MSLPADGSWRLRSERLTEWGGPYCLLILRQMGTQGSTYERGHSLIGLLGSSCRNKRFLSSSSQLLSAQCTIYFPHHALLVNFIVHFTQQAGQAVVPSRPSINMCLWLRCRSGSATVYTREKYSIEHRAGKAARLASWRKMTQPGEFSW